MRGLNRNKRTIYYANPVGEVAEIDEYGNETGEITLTYSSKASLDCNISAASGEEAVQAFGNFVDYTRTICVADPNCPLKENTAVWFDVSPSKPYNYIVVRKADTKNGVMYALREVSVS